MLELLSFYVFITVLAYSSADWLHMKKQSITKDRILQTINELSCTSCYLQCKMNKKCIFIRTAKRLQGGIGKCYLIGDDTSKYSKNVDSRVKKLYVMDMLPDHPISLNLDSSITDTTGVIKTNITSIHCSLPCPTDGFERTPEIHKMEMMMSQCKILHKKYQISTHENQI